MTQRTWDLTTKEGKARYDALLEVLENIQKEGLCKEDLGGQCKKKKELAELKLSVIQERLRPRAMKTDDPLGVIWKKIPRKPNLLCKNFPNKEDHAQIAKDFASMSNENLKKKYPQLKNLKSYQVHNIRELLGVSVPERNLSKKSTREKKDRMQAHVQAQPGSPAKKMLRLLLKQRYTIHQLSDSLKISREDVFKILEKLQKEIQCRYEFSGDKGENPTVRLVQEFDLEYKEIPEVDIYRSWVNVGFLYQTLIGSTWQQMDPVHTVYFTISQEDHIHHGRKSGLNFMIHLGGAIFGKITPKKREETFLNYSSSSAERNRIEKFVHEREDLLEKTKNDEGYELSDEESEFLYATEGLVTPSLSWEAERDYFVRHWPDFQSLPRSVASKKIRNFKTHFIAGAEERSFIQSGVNVMKAICDERTHDLRLVGNRFAFFPIKNTTLMVTNSLKGTYRGSYTKGARAQNTADAIMAEAEVLVQQYGLKSIPEIIVVAGDGSAVDFGQYAGTRLISLPVLNTYFKDNTAEGAPNFGFVWLHIPFNPDTDLVRYEDIEYHYEDLTELIRVPGY